MKSTLDTVFNIPELYLYLILDNSTSESLPSHQMIHQCYAEVFFQLLLSVVSEKLQGLKWLDLKLFESIVSVLPSDWLSFPVVLVSVNAV